MKDWALITGASSGIGAELARVFAGNGFNVVLAARNQSRLNALESELHAHHSIETRVVVNDLAEPEGPRRLFDSVQDLEIAILVNNAGLGFHGEFSGSDLREQKNVMQVNMTALVELTHLFLRPMLARGRGRILNVASTAAFQPGPLISVYYASKAFVHSFSYALASELEGLNITVSVLCPGTTHTRFFERGRFGAVRAPLTMEPRRVAGAGFRGLMQGKRVIIPGWPNKILSALARRMPLGLTTSIVRKIHAK